MNLQKVKLEKYGAAGVELSYIKESAKGGFAYNDEYKTKFKAHATISLKKAMRSLSEHVMLICRTNNSEDSKKAISVTAVKSDACTYFIIYGEIETFDGLSFKYETPMMSDGTEYKGFDNAIEIINEIYSEAGKYVSEEKAMTDRELVEAYAKLDVSVEELTPEQIKEEAIKIIENAGGFAIMPDDMEQSGLQDAVASSEADPEVTIESAIIGSEKGDTTQDQEEETTPIVVKFEENLSAKQKDESPFKNEEEDVIMIPAKQEDFY